MKKMCISIGLTVFSAWVVFWAGSTAAVGQDPAPKDQEGVEAMLRGPIHEAYATPESLNVKPGPIVPKQPPEPVPEMPPDQKPDGSHVIWIGGYWAWEDEAAEFAWISGFWRDVPPGKRWVPGHWMPLEGGFQWSSGFWSAETQTQISYLPPPPPSVENGPSTAAPSADHVYAPGCWVNVQQKYVWRPGFWLPCRANWVYVPAHYVWTPAGCVFIEGYWDYELHRRGLLFCPIRFTANVWTRPGWRLLPRFVVYPEVIVGALFVRIDFHRYYFGDYFDVKFNPFGFVAWVDYRLHKNIVEPLFHQFAWAHRAEVGFERDLRKLYVDRRAGIALRPPHTIAEQDRYLREIAANKTVKVGTKVFNVANVAAAERTLRLTQPLNKFEHAAIQLKPVTPAARADAIKRVEFHDTVKQERTVTETRIVKEAAKVKVGEAHPVGKISEVPTQFHAPAMVTTPTNPVLPKHEERVVPKYEPPRPTKLGTKPLHGSLDRRPMDWRQYISPRLLALERVGSPRRESSLL